MEHPFEQSLSEEKRPTSEKARRTFGIWFNSGLMAFWSLTGVAGLVIVNVWSRPHAVSNEVSWIAWALVFGTLAAGFFLMKQWAWGGTLLYWAVQTGLGLSKVVRLFWAPATFDASIDAFGDAVIPMVFVYYLLSHDCLNMFRIRKSLILPIVTVLIALFSAVVEVFWFR